MRGRGPWQEAQRSSLRYSMGTPLHDLAPQNTPNHSNRCGRSPGGWGPGWGLQHPGKKAWVLLTPEAGTDGRGMWGTKRMEGPRERVGGLILHAHPQGKATRAPQLQRATGPKSSDQRVGLSPVSSQD